MYMRFIYHFALFLSIKSKIALIENEIWSIIVVTSHPRASIETEAISSSKVITVSEEGF